MVQSNVPLTGRVQIGQSQVNPQVMTTQKVGQPSLVNQQVQGNPQNLQAHNQIQTHQQLTPGGQFVIKSVQ